MSFAQGKIYSMFVGAWLMVAVGLFILGEGLYRLLEGQEDKHAELDFFGWGKITGNQHLIIIALGVIVVGLGMSFIWKIDLKGTGPKKKPLLDRITHSASDITKEIAARIKLNRNKHKE